MSARSAPFPQRRGWLITIVIVASVVGTLVVTTGTADAAASGLEAPLPANANASPGVELSDVTCPNAGHCVAVGEYGAGKKGQALIETLSNGTWQPITAPVPSDAHPRLGEPFSAVSCSSARSCVAVGTYHPTVSTQYGYIDTLANGRWHAARPPLPANATTYQGSALVDVSCASAGTCAAIGVYDTRHGYQGVLDTFVAGKWSAVEAPLPAGALPSQDIDVTNVTCPSSGFCAAGGLYGAQPGQSGVVLWVWAKGSWSAVEAPLPSDASTTAPDDGIVALTCGAAGSCVALCVYNTSDGVHRGLVETLSQGTWTPTELADYGWYQVSCINASSCVASGGEGSTGHLLYVLSGGTWTAISVPLPPTPPIHRTPRRTRSRVRPTGPVWQVAPTSTPAVRKNRWL